MRRPPQPARAARRRPIRERGDRAQGGAQTPSLVPLLALVLPLAAGCADDDFTIFLGYWVVFPQESLASTCATATLGDTPLVPQTDTWIWLWLEGDYQFSTTNSVLPDMWFQAQEDRTFVGTGTSMWEMDDACRIAETAYVVGSFVTSKEVEATRTTHVSLEGMCAEPPVTGVPCAATQKEMWLSFPAPY